MRSASRLITARLLIVGFSGLFGGPCKDVQNINNTIATSTETLKQTTDKLGEDIKVASGNIDLIGVKKLLDQNDALRIQLVELQKKTQQFPDSVGITQLSGARLLLRIQSYRGDLSVSAYTDDKSNWILNPLTLAVSNAARIDVATPIPLNAEKAYAAYCDYANLTNDPWHTASNSWGAVEFAINRFAVPQIKDFIASSVNTIPSRQIDLQNNMPPGDHMLTVSIIPRSMDPTTGDWFLRLQLIQQFPDGSEQILRSGDWSSTIDTFVLGKPVERTQILPIKVISKA